MSKKKSGSAPAEKQSKKAEATAKNKPARSRGDWEKDYSEHPKFAKFKKGDSKK